MGMDADIIAIGPFGKFKELGILEYDEEFYQGASPESQVITTVAGAVTSDQSRDLADLVCVKPWELWNHRITKVVSLKKALIWGPAIGDDAPEEIVALIEQLLKTPDVQLWFRPNG